MKHLLNLLFHFRFKELFWEKTEDTFLQFFRSVFVGGIATVADFAAAACARELFSLPDLWANSVGFLVGLAVNFLLSCLFVFPKTKYGRLKEFLVFAVIGIIGLCINNGIVWLLSRFMNTDEKLLGFLPLFYLCKFIATLITLIWNFGARKLLLYTKKSKE